MSSLHVSPYGGAGNTRLGQCPLLAPLMVDFLAAPYYTNWAVRQSSVING